MKRVFVFLVGLAPILCSAQTGYHLREILNQFHGDSIALVSSKDCHCKENFAIEIVQPEGKHYIQRIYFYKKDSISYALELMPTDEVGRTGVFEWLQLNAKKIDNNKWEVEYFEEAHGTFYETITYYKRADFFVITRKKK